MRLIQCWVVILFLACLSADAQTTPNLHLNTPVPGSSNWGPAINSNFQIIDTWSTTVCPKSACTLTGPVTTPSVIFSGNNTTQTAAAVMFSLDPCYGSGLWPISYTPLACNNSTDDSAAFQALMTAVAASTTPVDIEFPVTTVALSKQIVVNNPHSAIRIHGQGISSALNWTAEDASGSGLLIENATVPVEISAMNFIGTTYVALQLLYDTGGTTVRNSYISGGAQGSTIAGVPPAGLYIQGGAHFFIDNNVFTANGPQTGATSCTNAASSPVICPQGYTFITDFQYFAGNLTQSLTKYLTFSNNRIYGNNNQIAMSGFNINQSSITDNYVNQNNAYNNDNNTDAESPHGYGILSYGNGHTNSASGTWVSTVRASNVVTETLTASTVVPYVVGQWICVNSNALGQTQSTQFSGCFTVASVSGSGGATPTFTWNQYGANDSLLASPDVVNANIDNHIVGNIVQNAAGSCIYEEAQIDSSTTNNQLFNCSQMMPSTTIPQGGIICNACVRDTYSNNQINTTATINPNQIGGQSYLNEGIGAFFAYDTSIGINSVIGFSHGGVTIGSAADGVSISGNTIDGQGTGPEGVLVSSAIAWNRVTVANNTLKNMTSEDIIFGAPAAGGYGYGAVISGNVMTGNTSGTPTTHAVLMTSGNEAQIVGNECYGLNNSNNSSRSVSICYEFLTGSRNDIHGNTANASSTSFFSMVISDSFDDVYGNVLYNVTNVLDASSSSNIRVHDNRFDLSGTAQTVSYSGSAIHWNNQLTTGAQRGTCVLSGSGTCTVNTTEIQTADIVQLTHTTSGGTLGNLTYGSISSGTSFVVTSSSSTDTSTVYWVIVH